MMKRPAGGYENGWRDFDGMWIVLAVIAVLLWIATPARAHEFYSGMVNPVTGVGCCGGVDCAPFPRELVKATDGGYLVSRPDARPAELVPYAEVLPSPDGQYHYCVFKWGRQQGERRCFIAPPQGF